MSITKTFLVVTNLIALCLSTNAQSYMAIVKNNCSEPKEIAIFTSSEDSVVQTIAPNTKTKIKYKEHQLRDARLFVEDKRYYLLPQKKAVFNINCTNNQTSISFIDEENKINQNIREKKFKFIDMANQFVFQVQLDTTLTEHQIDSLLTINNQYIDKADSVSYCEFVLQSPSLASLKELSTLVARKSDENKHKIDELYRLNKQSKALSKTVLMKDIERRMSIPKIEVGSTINKFKLTKENEITLNKDKYLIYYASPGCGFCNAEMKDLNNRRDDLKDVNIIIASSYDTEKYAQMCEGNNWTYYSDHDFLKEDIAYSLNVSGFPKGILIIDNVLVDRNFRIEKNKEMLGLTEQ